MDEATKTQVASEGADDLAPPAATPKKKGAASEVGKDDSAGAGAGAGTGDDGLADATAAPEDAPAPVTVTEPEEGAAAPVPELVVVAAATVPDLPIQFPVGKGAMGTSRIMVVTKLGLRATQQYDAKVEALVCERQEAAGLLGTGVVNEATYAIL